MTAVSTRHRSIWEPWAAYSRGPKASMMRRRSSGRALRTSALAQDVRTRANSAHHRARSRTWSIYLLYRLPRADDVLLMLVEAVGIEPTSGNPQPQASTSIAGLSYCALALRPSIRQEDRGANRICLAPPLRRRFEPATRACCRYPG